MTDRHWYRNCPDLGNPVTESAWCEHCGPLGVGLDEPLEGREPIYHIMPLSGHDGSVECWCKPTLLRLCPECDGLGCGLCDYGFLLAPEVDVDLVIHGGIPNTETPFDPDHLAGSVDDLRRALSKLARQATGSRKRIIKVRGPIAWMTWLAETLKGNR